MVTVAAAGIDTWSPCWYVDRDSMAAAMLDDLATLPAKRGRMVPDTIGGHRVGWFRDAGLLYAEGHPVEDRLAPVVELPDALQALTAAMVAADVPVPYGRVHEDLYGGRYDGFAGLRRLDVTLDLAAPDAGEGIALLSGVAAISPPGTLAAEVRRQRGGRAVETVSWFGARGKVARVYDKATEAGIAARGEVVRMEAQYRWGRGARRAVEDLSPSYVRGKFEQRFAPLWKASKGIKVMGKSALLDRVEEAVAAGDLTVAQAEQVVAFQLFKDRRGLTYNERTSRRRRRLIEEAGLILSDHGGGDELEIDLADVLGAALGAEAWGRDG